MTSLTSTAHGSRVERHGRCARLDEPPASAPVAAPQSAMARPMAQTCSGRRSGALRALGTRPNARRAPLRRPEQVWAMGRAIADWGAATGADAGGSSRRAHLPWRSTRDPWAAVSYTHLRAHETRHDLVC